MQLTNIIVALFAAGAIAGPVVREVQQCGDNEIYQDSNSDCPKPEASCSVPAGGIGLTVCGPSKCYCAKGFVRNADKKCVKKSECPSSSTSNDNNNEQKCYGDNESFTNCGSSCVKTCAVPSPEVCTADCRPGCQCNEGYVRKYNKNVGGLGECVKVDACPADASDTKKICNGDNEEWKTAGTSCPENCFKKDQICDKKGNAGCYCKKGYVRLNYDGTGKCVKADTCPSKTVEKPCAASTAAAVAV